MHCSNLKKIMEGIDRRYDRRDATLGVNFRSSPIFKNNAYLKKFPVSNYFLFSMIKNAPMNFLS